MCVDYDLLAKTIAALTEGETDVVSLMATVACEVHHADTRFAWTGFYRVTGPEVLKVGPYQGGHGCLVIPFSRGVCGAAARTGTLLGVFDIDSDQPASFDGDDATHMASILKATFAVAR